MHGMDVVLVDRGQGLVQALRATLLPGDRLVQAGPAQLAAGSGWPEPERTRAILLAADRLDAPTLRALNRLWVAEHGPPSWLLSTPGSAGDRLLETLAGRTTHRLAGATCRGIRELTLVHLLALQRLAGRA